jgi:hypothetical protein
MLKRAGAAIVVGATAGLLVALITTSLAADVPPRVSGTIASMGLTVAALVGLGTAGAFLLVRTGKRNPGLALFALVSLASVGFVGWVSSRIPPRPVLVLAASDRAELREFHDAHDGEDRRGIEHETLGFRLPNTTIALLPSQQIEDETRTVMGPGWADQHEMWAFETADHGVSVMIDLARAESADRASLDALETAVTGPLEAAGHAVTRHSVTGAPGCLREPFDAHLDNGGRVDAVLFAFEEQGRSFRLVVTVVSDGSGDWAGWIDDVSLACERDPTAR